MSARVPPYHPRRPEDVLAELSRCWRHSYYSGAPMMLAGAMQALAWALGETDVRPSDAYGPQWPEHRRVVRQMDRAAERQAAGKRRRGR